MASAMRGLVGVEVEGDAGEESQLGIGGLDASVRQAPGQSSDDRGPALANGPGELHESGIREREARPTK